MNLLLLRRNCIYYKYHLQNEYLSIIKDLFATLLQLQGAVITSVLTHTQMLSGIFWRHKKTQTNLRNTNVWQYKNNLQCPSHGLLPFIILTLWTYLIIKMHKHHLNCTTNITVFFFLFSFFQRCIFLRRPFCTENVPDLLVYCLEVFYLLLQFWPMFSGFLHHSAWKTKVGQNTICPLLFPLINK